MSVKIPDKSHKRNLNLSYRKLTDLSKFILNFTNLKMLQLNGNKLTFLLESVCNLFALEEL